MDAVTDREARLQAELGAEKIRLQAAREREESGALPILDNEALVRAGVAKARRVLELRIQVEAYYESEQMSLGAEDGVRWWVDSGDTENFYDWEGFSDGTDVNLEPLDYYGSDYGDWQPWMSDEGYMTSSYHDAR